MKPLVRGVVVLATILMLVGCTARSQPGWTVAPATAAPSQSGEPATSGEPTPNAGQASGSPAEPTANAGQPSTSPAPAGDDSVIPDLTPIANLSPVPAGELNTAYAPNVPPAATRTNQAIVDVHFDVVEGAQAIDPNGTQYTTWGYRLHGDSTVTTGTPGPIIRARVGDVLRFTLTNDGTMPHNVDFHAVTGQGGGAADTTVAPGETATIEARLLYPGMFMYHCAAGDVPAHIAQGMYGGILVDPQTPLAPVQKELYMVQSEFYTNPSVNGGPLTTNRTAMTNEDPTYVVFNGAVGSLTGANAPQVKVGDHVRIYFINSGLNLDSNFHPIGSHWDKVWFEDGLLDPPLRGIQTTLVPAGGGVVVELIAQVPSTIVLVDHALARAFDKGAIGQIVITGDPNPEIFQNFPIQTAAPGTTPTALPSIAVSSPSVGPSEPASPPASGAPGGYTVTIDPGASTFQAANAPDEFADTEVPPDYTPNVLMVPIGATVTWTNDDPGIAHSVTAVDGSFDSGMFNTGESFSHTFDKPGEFEYFCTPHPWMRGKVQVMMH